MEIKNILIETNKLPFTNTAKKNNGNKDGDFL
jgi:hypothetical protein